MEPDVSAPRILIVDDVRENLQILATTLRSQYQLNIALDGEKALEIARSPHPPDLILLDIMMPGMDGYEVCRRLKADDKTKHIPVIFVTAKIEARDETKGFELGAVDYITKPISLPIIKARIKTHLELKQHRDKAEAATRAKSQFLAMMSHDIRTPMNAILGMTEQLMETEPSPERLEYLNVIKMSANELMLLLNDILDFSKIEAGRLDLVPIDFSLRDCVGDTLKSVAVTAHAKGLELAYRIDPNMWGVVHGDWTRLRQVLVNLVGNAVNYTDKGEVVVRVEPVSTGDTGGVFHFSVSDTGIGVPPDRQEVIFHEFEQAGSPNAGQQKGTGLGLAICSRLVELMGGRIWVESEVGQGSVFHFTVGLGIGKGGAGVSNSVPSGDIGDLKVLVVDDNLTYARILEEELGEWRINATLVENGEQACRALDYAHVTGKPFSLAVIDCAIPQTDSLELVKRIRQDPRLEGLGMILLTLSGQRIETAGFVKLGVGASLTKPTKQSELLAAIYKVAGIPIVQPIVASPVCEGETPSAETRISILLAEDKPINRKLVQRMLEKMGHSVVLARNGEEAIRAAQEQSFDLILMDVQMPLVDGLQAARAIREGERDKGKHVPIVAMTGFAMEGDREQCHEAGMDDYISKPISSGQLVGVVSKLVSGDYGPWSVDGDR